MPIGVEFGLPEKHGCGACILQRPPSGPVGGRSHDGKGNAPLPQHRMVAGCKFDIGGAVALEVDDDQTRPCGLMIRQDRSQGRFTCRRSPEMTDGGRAMGCQHTGQQMGRMFIVINQDNERGIGIVRVQKVTSRPRAARVNAYKTQDPFQPSGAGRGGQYCCRTRPGGAYPPGDMSSCDIDEAAYDVCDCRRKGK